MNAHLTVWGGITYLEGCKGLTNINSGSRPPPHPSHVYMCYLSYSNQMVEYYMWMPSIPYH